MLCQRCHQAEAVVNVARITADAVAADAVVGVRQLCAMCARQEGMLGPGQPPEPGPTGAERFRALHAHALRLLARLEATYDVTRSEAFPSYPGALFPSAPAARLPVLLTPRLPEAAPLAVAFTEAPGRVAPGLVVRCGRWHEAPFGAAFGGADHPWATLTGEAERLEDLVGKVVDGLFAEAVRRPLVGGARLAAAFGDGTLREGLNGEGWMRVPRAQVRALVGAGGRTVRWRPWPRRRLWFSADLHAAEPGSSA